MNVSIRAQVAGLLAAATLLASQAPLAFNMPPRNPFLADSNYAMAHADAAQQDALPQAGPGGPDKTLSGDDIQYVHTGPGFFGISTSGEYSDGRRVFWGNGLDRIVKLDYDTHEIVAQLYFPGVAKSCIITPSRMRPGAVALLETIYQRHNFGPSLNPARGAERDRTREADIMEVHELPFRDLGLKTSTGDGSIARPAHVELHVPVVPRSARVNVGNRQHPGSRC